MLAEGYAVVGPDGEPTTTLDALVRIEGGFVHILIADTVQVVSAPAIRRLTYPASPEDKPAPAAAGR